MNDKRELCFSLKECAVILLLSLAIAGLPHLAMWLIDLTDGMDENQGADIGGGLFSLISPIGLTFILGLIRPMATKMWLASAALAFIWGSALEVALHILSWEEVFTLSAFTLAVYALIAGAGVWGSHLGKIMRD